jgi:hypothetical protein
MLGFWPKEPPPVSAVRPSRCPRCGVATGPPGRLGLEGHGVRWRDVVVPGEVPTLERAWARRFHCERCGGVCIVGPPGVLPRYVYALTAILGAWFLAAARPVGDGLSDEAVYARTGVDRRKDGGEPGRAGVRRWRSLRRWAGQLEAWWPTRPVPEGTWRERVASLLVGFLPGDEGRDGATRRAVVAHAAGGTAM